MLTGECAPESTHFNTPVPSRIPLVKTVIVPVLIQCTTRLTTSSFKICYLLMRKSVTAVLLAGSVIW